MYYRSKGYIILAPNSLPTRKTKSLYDGPREIPKEILNQVDRKISEQKLPKEYLVVIQLGTDPLKEVPGGEGMRIEIFTPEDATLKIPSDEDLYGPGEKMRKRVPIEQRFYDELFFSVGRTNGPTSQVTVDEIHDGIRYRYDVNSRIEISFGPEDNQFIITFTFKAEKLRNMAKLVYPNKQVRVILQADFDLWTLGLFILTQQFDKAGPLVHRILDKYKQE